MSTSSEAPGLARIPFTEKDEATLKGLHTWLTIFSAVSLVKGLWDLGTLAYAQALVPAVLVGSLISIFLGVWGIQAANAFRNVAVTDSADQAFLVKGFLKLRALFLVQSLLVIIALLVPIVFLVTTIVAGAIRASRAAG